MEESLISEEEAQEVIKFARDNIIHYLNNREPLEIPSSLREKYSMPMGAFVTLNKRDGSSYDLRGCIGYIQAIYPMIETIQKTSISAAVEDPRFPNVSINEMENIKIEISLLTEPEVIKVDDPYDYFKEIVIGRDGLIVEKGFNRGLLLPQVPTDHGRNWDVREFLYNTCQKAFLPPDAWKSKRTKVSRFQALVFQEKLGDQ